MNVTGRKKWILFPPEEEHKIRDSFGNLPLLFDHSIHSNIKFFEIIQEKGDAIFVPSGWHHQVTNLVDTISINHNWINGCNVQQVWKALQECFKTVEHEIEEYKDTPEYQMQCQTILKSLFGMDFESFICFLCYIARKRLRQLAGRKYLVFQKYTLGMTHIQFDLSMILKVMDNISSVPKFFEKYSLMQFEETFFTLRSNIIDNINIQHLYKI